MARRSEHSQAEIKQMVLEAAEDIVRENGYSALKVRKIAADIGYTVGSIYMVFANMNDLNMHIKARTWQKLYQYLQTQLTQPATPATMKNIALAYLDFSVDNEGLWRMLFEHQLALGEPVPDWYLQESQRVFGLMHAPIRQLDHTHSDNEIQLAAQVLMKSVQGIAMQLLMQKQSLEYIKMAKSEIVVSTHAKLI
ncbi:TetR/AcrR family transcriptional regulator [Methyloprofundus sp.]|uniref:TetR/AcrR family transcriptional regulator n=1 Tax=Methyloprofundus sp. TaxID=2020875 RepID=UPI003D1422DC